jgi:non-ribosomal peptide synthetase component E (peptide arylation enzyme)
MGKVAEAVVVQQHVDPQQLQAFVIMSTDPGAATPRYLHTLLRDLPLPIYLRPTRAIILDVMPLTRVGGVDHQHLQVVVIP